MTLGILGRRAHRARRGVAVEGTLSRLVCRVPCMYAKMTVLRAQGRARAEGRK